MATVASADGSSRGWKLVYQDDGYSLFVKRQIAEGLPVADRRGERIVATFP
jgi:hypothetical protein